MKKCPIRGCNRTHAFDKLMCGPCWSRVPSEIKDEVWEHYRPGQERSKSRPSAQYFRAVSRALRSVNEARNREALL